MVWRAAAAIELGICEVVVCATASRPRPKSPIPHPPNTRASYGASSMEWGSPQAEFDVPYGNVAQNCGYAMYAQRYHDRYGWDERSRAKIASDQRVSACANPAAAFYGQPITVDDVLESRLIAAPLHLLEIVMPCTGGAAFVVTTSRTRARLRAARGSRHRVRRTAHPQDADLRGGDAAHTRARRGRERVRHVGARALRRRHGAAVRLLHDHRVAHHRGLRLLRRRRGSGVRGGPRPLLPWRLPVQHPRWPAGHGPNRAERWDVTRARGGTPDPGPGG